VKTSPSTISVIMVDGGFRERFHLIDALNDQTLPPSQYELIWVECFDAIRPELASRENVQFALLNRSGQPYSMSHCFNEGIRRARGELLVIPDADVFVGRTFLQAVLDEHEQNEELVMYVRRYDQPEEGQGPVELDHLERTCRLQNPTNYGGCLTVRKKGMLAVNGYEQHPIFQGMNFAGGKDLYVRFRNLGLPIKWHEDLKVYHPWHPNPKVAQMNREKVAAQRECIRRRALSLMALPYQGLDRRLDTEAEWLPAWSEQRRRARSGLRRLLRLVNKLVRSGRGGV